MTSECLSCGRPLGAESKENNWEYCHTCRSSKICSKCGLLGGPVSQQDMQFCLDNELPLTHSRCLILDNTLTPGVLPIQGEIDHLNLCRLMIWPTTELSETGNMYAAEQVADKLLIKMTGEEQYLFMRRVQAIAARASLIIKKDSPAIKEEMTKRASKAFEAAKKQAETSSRPVGTRADDDYEVVLAALMLKFGIKDRKLGIKKMQARDKAIASFTKHGMSTEDAAQVVDKAMTLGKQDK